MGQREIAHVDIVHRFVALIGIGNIYVALVLPILARCQRKQLGKHPLDESKGEAYRFFFNC